MEALKNLAMAAKADRETVIHMEKNIMDLKLYLMKYQSQVARLTLQLGNIFKRKTTALEMSIFEPKGYC